ncbi:MAG: hypothetical protein IKA56_03390 [Clostridia bacterium]|nr:hypothetical protein [Clostridia bacterium]
MKKIIAILLAVLMTFSFATIAFAEEANEGGEGSSTVAPEGSNPFQDMTEEEILDMIMGLDMYTVKAVLKIAKIGVKLAFVFDKLGIIDLSPIKNAILDMVWDLVGGFVEDNAPEAAPAIA